MRRYKLFHSIMFGQISVTSLENQRLLTIGYMSLFLGTKIYDLDCDTCDFDLSYDLDCNTRKFDLDYDLCLYSSEGSQYSVTCG